MTSYTNIAAQAAATITISGLVAAALFLIADFATRGLVVVA
ncbi:MAG: hypothetical protein R3C58_12845 [Parvularculaceae bacterium]